MADWFAQVNGTGSPDDPANPSNLGAAVAAAADGDTIFCRLSNTGVAVVFQENLERAQAINDDITLDTYVGDGAVRSIPGLVAIEGNIVIAAGTTLTLAGNLELQLVGEPARFELGDGAEVNGDGVLAFTATGGNHTILLGNPNARPPFTPHTATIRNLRIDKPNGDVDVIDSSPTDTQHSNLHITNRLQVDAGFLNLHDNHLHITARPQAARSGEAPGVAISGGAIIDGDGTFFIAVEAAAQGGFPNTRAGAFPIAGEGTLNMRFEKTTDAGVVIRLGEIGSGGTSVNRAGALYAPQVVQFNGTFRNESGARTEFPALGDITANLEVVGPGGEVFGGEGRCGSGFESGVYVNPGVAIEGQVILVNTDDPNLPCGIQGLSRFTFPPPPPPQGGA